MLYNLACIDWRALPAEAALRSEAWTLQALSLLSHALTSIPCLKEPVEEESLHRLLLALYVLLGGASDNGPAPGAIETAKELELDGVLRALNLPGGSKLATLAMRCGDKLK